MKKKMELSREAIACKEVGHTDINRRGSVVLTACFLLLVFLVPMAQIALDRGEVFEPMLSLPGKTGISIAAAVNYANQSVLKNIDQLETQIEEDSLLRRIFLPSMQYVFFRFLGHGNEKVLPGRNAHLFYSAGIDYLLGQSFIDPGELVKKTMDHNAWESPIQPDPVAAIVHFRDQLALRGIDLLIVPIPVKGGIEPENFVDGSFTRPLRNRGWSSFVSQLEEQNVRLFDVGPVLVDYSRRHGGAFLRTDTHWLSGAMEDMAQRLAEYIDTAYPHLSGRENEFKLRAEDVIGSGDIAGMLTLPADVKLSPLEQVTINQVLSQEDEYWQADPGSGVLLLGDSFTNMYSFKGLGWGFGAGLPEHLSFRLRMSLDLIARNDSGAFTTREILARELSRGRDRLAGKKMVVWEFSERELFSGNWKMVELNLKDPVDSWFFVSAPGEKRMVTGLVSSISVSPRPGSVPYKDNIVTLHLVEIKEDGQDMEFDQALVYGWGMRDNILMDLVAVRAGDKITLKLSSWDDVEGENSSFRRTPLADELLELELPNWGELVDE